MNVIKPISFTLPSGFMPSTKACMTASYWAIITYHRRPDGSSYAMDLNNKVVALTGATGGLGKALAKRLSEKGCQVILVGRRADQLQAVAADLPSQVRTLCVNDLSSSIDLHKLAIELRKLDIDILINNAGTNEFGSFQALGEAAIDTIVALNLVSPMKLT